jgi:putative component of toxin-antitoxin plasmid stabilization module
MSDALELVFTPWYTDEVRALQKDGRIRIDRTLAHLVKKGWDAATKDATVKHLRDGIHEIRVLGRGAAYRVLFFVAPGRSPRVVVLTTCAAKAVMKKRQRMDAEIGRAMDRRAWWIDQQTRKTEEERDEP